MTDPTDPTCHARLHNGPARRRTIRSGSAHHPVQVALHESQRALATLLSNLPGMAYRCRNDRDWTTEFVSDGVLALTGYRAHDFVEHRVAYNDLIHPEDREWLWADTQR